MAARKMRSENADPNLRRRGKRGHTDGGLLAHREMANRSRASYKDYLLWALCAIAVLVVVWIFVGFGTTKQLDQEQPLKPQAEDTMPHQSTGSHLYKQKDNLKIGDMKEAADLHDADYHPGVHLPPADMKGNMGNTNMENLTTDKAVFVKLYEWLVKHGSHMDKVYFDYNDRTLRAARDIENGETILTVTPKLFMSTCLAHTDGEMVKKLDHAKGGKLSVHQALAVYLLEQRKKQESGAHAHFAPYIDALPQAYSDIPLFWDEKSRTELQGDSLKRYNDRMAGLRNDYDDLKSREVGFENFCTFDEFKWARTVIITRTFGLRVGGNQDVCQQDNGGKWEDKITSNVPIDFVMHANDPDTTWGFDVNTGLYYVRAIKNIPKDAFLTITYGHKSSARFLVNYGFTLRQNSRNKGFINVQWDASNEYDLQKYELMINKKSVQETWDKFHEKLYRKGDSFWETEKRIVDRIHTECRNALKAFPTDMEADMKRLKELEGTYEANAVVARMGEKSVLAFYVRLCEHLGSQMKSLLGRMDKNGHSHRAAGGENNRFKQVYHNKKDLFVEENLVQDE